MRRVFPQSKPAYTVGALPLVPCRWPPFCVPHADPVETARGPRAPDFRCIALFRPRPLRCNGALHSMGGCVHLKGLAWPTSSCLGN